MPKIISEKFSKEGDHILTTEYEVEFDDIEKEMSEFNLSHIKYDIVNGVKTTVGGTVYNHDGGWHEVRLEVNA